MIQRHFTALKGVAIVLVVLNHAITLGLLALNRYGYAPPPEVERYVLVALQELGLVAVPTFLFLSGCYMAYAMQGKGLIAAYKTIWGSLKHIVWPYLIWSIVFYLAIYVLQNDHFTLLQYAKDLLVGYPFNYVPLLVAFYMVGPLLVRIGRSHSWQLLLVTATYQIFLINIYSPGSVGFVFPVWARYLSPPVLRDTLGVWGIHFPLGLVYGLHAKSLLPRLRQFWPLLVAAGTLFYGVLIVSIVGGRNATLAEPFCAVSVMLVFPLIKRESIPMVNLLEQYGKRAYGLYLTNLIVLSIALAIINVIAPWALSAPPPLLVLVLSLVTLALPAWLMAALDRLPTRTIQRYVFG